MMKFRTLFFALSFLALALANSCQRAESPSAPSTSSASADAGGEGRAVLMKTASAYSTTLPAVGTPIVFVAEQLKQISGGNVEVKIYEPNKLVPPLEILDAVSSGKVSAGYAAAGFWVGKIPAAPLFSAVPFGPEALEYVAWMYHGNGRKLHQEMYDNAGYDIHAVPCAMLSPETSGWFKEEITSPAQLKGLNIRFFGLGAKVMEKLGANPSLLPGGEVFGALEKGQIDAAEFSMPAIDERLGFHKIVKNNYYPGWHQQATLLELIINKNFWGELSERQRAMIELTCMASMTNSVAEAEAAQGAAMVRQRDENGVKLRRWNDEMLAAYRRAWREVLEEQREDEMFRKVWDDFADFRASYDLWEKNAFLPRE